MSKIIAVMFVLMLTITSVYADDFNPSLMKLTASDAVQYDFDGSNLEIPVTVSGAPAGLIFSVFSKDNSDQIISTHNGYLGWHYVNKVDTCLYYSDLQSVDVGSATVSWDGKDQDGNVVPAGDYTYYMWGYDNVNPKSKAYTVYNIRPRRGAYLEEFGAGGEPLVQPFIISGTWKWTIGYDPLDDSYRETVNIVLPEGVGRKENVQFDPNDPSFFYAEIGNDESGELGVWKFNWVPNGDAEVVTEWGENGSVQLPVSATGGHSNNWYSGVGTDTNYLYVTHCNRTDPIVDFYTIDFDGSIVNEHDISDWWANPAEEEAGGQMTGGPNTMMIRNGLAYLNSHTSCLQSVADPIRGLNDEDDFWVWHNSGGDYVGDHNFEEDSASPWVCFDFNVAPYTYTFSADDNHFSIAPAYDMGAVSFALYAPDGTGIGYMAYSGETAGTKEGEFICDTGSAYDGIYTNNASTGDEENASGLWYVASDSIIGTITSQVSVEEAPSAFSVAQNVPNPFNPTTTINFTTASAGNVSIDVFNVAGQKVDTVANEFMSAGNHALTWNASAYSAGVYFYTVKTGELSKTMKMTLLK